MIPLSCSQPGSAPTHPEVWNLFSLRKTIFPAGWEHVEALRISVPNQAAAVGFIGTRLHRVREEGRDPIFYGEQGGV